MPPSSHRSELLLLIVGVLLLAGGFTLYLFARFHANTPRGISAGYLATAGDPLVSRSPSLPTATKPSITASNPRRGPADAKVVLVAYSDFSCPYCKTMAANLSRVLIKHPGVALVWKDFPATSLHPEAAGAHVAARCAGAQGKFWEFHDWLFSHDDHSRPGLVQASKDLNLNLAALDTCLTSETMQRLVAADLIEGGDLNIDATPYLFIGDQRISGLLTEEELDQVITLHEKIANGSTE